MRGPLLSIQYTEEWVPLHATRCTGRQQEADPWLACTAVVGRAHGALKDASVLAPGGLSQEQSTRSPAGGQPEASLLTMPLTEVMEGWGLRGSQGAIRVTRETTEKEKQTCPGRPILRNQSLPGPDAYSLAHELCPPGARMGPRSSNSQSSQHTNQKPPVPAGETWCQPTHQCVR